MAFKFFFYAIESFIKYSTTKDTSILYKSIHRYLYIFGFVQYLFKWQLRNELFAIFFASFFILMRLNNLFRCEHNCFHVTQRGSAQIIFKN